MLYYAKLSPIFSQLASFYFWLPKNRELLSTYTKISVLWSSGTIWFQLSITHILPPQCRPLCTAEQVLHCTSPVTLVSPQSMKTVELSVGEHKTKKQDTVAPGNI